jgi:hypothetical protein
VVLRFRLSFIVVPGLDPGIHASARSELPYFKKSKLSLASVDGRVDARP